MVFYLSYFGHVTFSISGTVVVEAVIAFEIAKAFLDKFSGDCMADVKAYYDVYMNRIKNF